MLSTRTLCFVLAALACLFSANPSWAGSRSFKSLACEATLVGHDSAFTMYRDYLRTLYDLERPSDERMLELWKEYQNTKSKKALEEMVVPMLPLVIARSNKYYTREMFELIQAGNEGLIEGIKRHKTTMTRPVAVSMILYVRVFMVRYVLANSSTVKFDGNSNNRKVFQRIGKTTAALTKQLKREPTNEEIAAAMEVPIAAVEDMRLLVGDSNHKSLDAPLSLGDDTDRTLLDFQKSDTPGPEELVKRKTDHEWLHTRLDQFFAQSNESARNEEIFRALNLTEEPPTKDMLAEKYSFSRQSVGAINEKIWKKFSAYLVARGDLPKKNKRVSTNQ